VSGAHASDRPIVLCVDDDRPLLDLIERHLSSDYRVLVSDSGEGAIEILAQTPGTSVVIADMKMPKMDGVTLLAKIRVQSPAVVRIMLTGDTDQAVASQAINSGQVFRFLPKSCTREQLRRAVSDAVDQHQLIVAEQTLLQGTLLGAIQALMDSLAVVNPIAFGRAHRIRRLVLDLAKRVELLPSWSLEAAALLSQLGYLAVPEAVLERMLAGDRLSNTERRQIDRVPTVTCDLLGKIPRLEPVIEMISSLDAAFESRVSDVASPLDLLRIAADFDRYLLQTGDPQRAIESIRSHVARYPSSLISSLAAHIGADQQIAAMREVVLNRVCAGMVLVDEVRTDTGALLVPAGFEVTAGFLERLRNFPPGVSDRAIRVRVTAVSDSPAPQLAAASAR